MGGLRAAYPHRSELADRIANSRFKNIAPCQTGSRLAPSGSIFPNWGRFPPADELFWFRPVRTYFNYVGNRT